MSRLCGDKKDSSNSDLCFTALPKDLDPLGLAPACHCPRKSQHVLICGYIPARVSDILPGTSRHNGKTLTQMQWFHSQMNPVRLFCPHGIQSSPLAAVESLSQNRSLLRQTHHCHTRSTTLANKALYSTTYTSCGYEQMHYIP